MNTNFKIGEYYQHGKAQTVVLITDLEAMPHTDLAIIVVAQINLVACFPVVMMISLVEAVILVLIIMTKRKLIL